MSSTNFITQEDALELVGRDDVSFVDGSWYLPAQNRDGHAEYLSMRIPGAVFFDIDEVSDPDSDLPHMLPTQEDFALHVSALGISDQHLIIIYDGPGLFSAPRVWWTFRLMGAPDVRILEGGFDGWRDNNLPFETGNPNPRRAHIFNADRVENQVADIALLQDNVNTNEAVVIDARPNDRFRGLAGEPRPGLRSGHIPGSLSLHFQRLLEDGKMKSPEELDAIFNELGINQDTRVITTCGSGVSAAILTLALEETGRHNHLLYDGSWAEWGLPNGPPVERDDQ